MPLIINSMDQKRSKKRFMHEINLRKPLCAALILCSCLIASPTVTWAADGVETTQNVNQQQITVKGTVVDVNGEPIIGASIAAKGGTTGTITDIDGNFSLSIPENTQLVVSFIGYERQFITPKAGQPLKIVLKEDTEVLDEVVVVGYGAVKRANLTGAVSSVKMNDLADNPATNLTSVLMGTMSGVTVGEASGNPLANATIKIRTNGSWNAEPPLYVIDGFIRDEDSFNLLDPSEIDNISVLKDAAAAVYGVRGAGGVILVTTKKGKAGKVSVNYSGSVGFSQGVSMPDMMSAYQQASALNDMWTEEIRSGEDPVNYAGKFFSEQELNDMKDVDYNWLDDAWKTAINTRHTLNVSGGSDKVRYFLGGSYMYNNGNFANLDVDRFSTRMGVDVNFTKELKASFNMNYATKSSNMPLNNKDAEPALMYGTFNDLNRMSRWVPAYIDGLPVGYDMKDNSTHPLAIFDSGSFKKNRSDDMSMGARLDYDIKWVKGLSASLSVNYSRSASTGKSIYRPYTVYIFEKQKYYDQDGVVYDGRLLTDKQIGTQRLSNGDSYSDGSNFGYSYQINPQLNYHIKLRKHDISAMYVYEVAETGGNKMSLSTKTMLVDNVDNIGGYDKNGIIAESGDNTKGRRMSHIGRLNYSWADRYLFEGTIRYEASSNFAPNYRWGLFYSLAGSWRISEEAWFRDNIKGVDNLKLRASYGRLGNDKVSLGQWRQSYGLGSGTFIIGNNVMTTVKPSLSGLTVFDSSWEKTDNYNIGLDLDLRNGFSFNADGFFKHTFDILDDAKSTFPQSAGVAESTPKLNYGIQNAWGVELSLGYRRQFNKDWSFNVRGNFAFARSKVIRKYQNPGVAGTWQDEEGRMRGGEVGYKVWRGKDGKGDGMARTWQDVEDYIDYLASHTANGSKESIDVLGSKWDELRPGMLMYEDRGTTLSNQTPDGIINSSGDNCIISKYDSAPYNYSLNLGFSWKSLSVSALLSGQFGYDVVFDKGFYTAVSGGKRSGDFLSETSNQLAEWYGNYARSNEDKTLINPDAKYPRLDSKSFRGERSDFWLRNGHSLRLRTLNVSYTLPKKVLSNLGLSTCRVFFNANNLWTIINPFPYKDAYVSFWSDYPQIRTFNFGINIGI